MWRDYMKYGDGRTEKEVHSGKNTDHRLLSDGTRATGKKRRKKVLSFNFIPEILVFKSYPSMCPLIPKLFGISRGETLSDQGI